MRICSKCNIEKNEGEYFVKDKTNDRLHSQCIDCYREHRKTYQKEHYRKYGDVYRERARVSRARLKRHNQIELIKYMRDKACIECSENDIRVLEFDHIEPSKKSFGIAWAINNGKPWDAILSEIEKCQILCANCHKKRTAIQYGWFKAQNLN